MSRVIALPARRLLAGVITRPHASVRNAAMAAMTKGPNVLSAEYLLQSDQKLGEVRPHAPEYLRKADSATIERTVQALQQHKRTVEVVQTREEALQAIKAQIPNGVSVYNTSSIGLTEIGYVDWVIRAKDSLPFDNWNARIVAEKDPAKQLELRRQSLLADVVISTPVALVETGEVLIADASGTRVTPTLTGRKVVFVVGTQKIVPTLDAALRRLHEFAYPLESARLRAASNNPDGKSTIANTVVLHTQGVLGVPKVHVILVNDVIGF